jgi:hypothetical protein
LLAGINPIGYVLSRGRNTASQRANIDIAIGRINSIGIGVADITRGIGGDRNATGGCDVADGDVVVGTQTLGIN